ncbi:MAG: ABC transporter substrate-binding protein [Gemmatimonadales bacterium]
MLVAPLAAACGSVVVASPEPAVAQRVDACALNADSARLLDTVVVALDRLPDPAHAPRPRTESERLVFRHLYEPLIRVDCAGRAWPGLATSWVAADNGRRWTLTLRDGARFWDGTPVNARDVLASWAAGGSAGPAPWGGPLAEAVTIIDERTLEVRFVGAWDAVPVPLADPGLAVHQPAATSSWPWGTGAWRTEQSSGALVAAPAFGGTLPVLRFRVTGGDARDALDDGADLLLTRDPAAVAYATRRPELASLPLPWDRTYVLLQPWRARAATGPVDLPDDVRADLEDAVREEARPATRPFWWDDVGACSDGAAPPGETAPPDGDRMAYSAEDRTARDLTGRLVARATTWTQAREGVPRGGPRLVSAGLTPAEFARVLRAGTEGTFVLALPRTVLDPCAAVRELVGRAPWLAAAPGGPARAMAALVDTRPSVIVRRGVGRMTVDWDGTPSIARQSP